MTDVLDQLIAIVRFRLGLLTAFDLIDLFLVTAVYYVLFAFIRRSKAAALLRGVLVLLLFLVTITLLFPLPTLRWVITGLVITLVIAVPITLQPELRRWLEGLGRSRLLGRRQQQLASQIAPPLRKVIEQCAEHHMGALVVVEGRDPLNEIIQSGIRVDARLSAELLNTIFFDKTPLHDGAVILREDRVIAASCVLPLTQQTLPSYRRLGTRHRAAVGMSEVCDALVIVVSEETGHLSLARKGALQSRQDVEELQQVLANFYTATDSREEKKRFWRRHGVLGGIGRFLLYTSFAFLLALLTWGATIERTNPTEETVVNAVPLRINGLSDDITMMNAPPANASVTIRTTSEILQTLNADSFQAVANLACEAGCETGLIRRPVNVTTSVEDVDILSVWPSEVDIDIVPIITRTFPIDVRITGQETLSVIYELTTAPQVTPSEVVVRGPQPLVERIRTVRTDVSVANATQAIRRTVSLSILGVEGEEISGVTLEPSQAQVTVSVQQRDDVREVAVNVVTTGTPPDGYWLSAIQVKPVAVTLLGEPELLDTLSGYLDTLPIDLSETYGTLETAIPLDLPPEVQVLDRTGAAIQQVDVQLEVSPRQGDILLTRPIEVQNGEGMTVTVSAETVDLLLSGDLPTLREIEDNPELVRVTVDAVALPIGRSTNITPTIILPEGIQYQLVNSFIAVTKETPD